MSDWLILISAILAGAIVAQAAIPPIDALCHRRGWLDRPGSRKVHTHPTPRLTGVALYLSIWIVMLGASIWAGPQMSEFNTHALAFWSGGLVILALGVIDDVHPLSSWVKLGVEVAVGTMLYATGIGFDRLWVPFVGGIPLGIWAWAVTLTWFLVVVNAVNIIDGLDGLAVSTTAWGAVTLIWVSWTIHLPPVWIGAAGLLGGLLIFWRYNRPPAKVFMGDSGSLSIGYFFAIVALFAPIKRFTALAFFVPILALLVPLLESAFSFTRRSLAGGNPLHGDTGHLHHQLQRAGFTHTQILLSYNAVAVVIGAFCVTFRYGNRRLLTIFLGIFVLSVLVGLAIILRRRNTRIKQSDN